MPFYKYTVANIEGKKLSGTVEAPDENTARTELNNLGFSILQLTEAPVQQVASEDDTQKFVFEAIDKNSKQISGTMPSQTKEDALRKLESEYDLTITAIWQQNANEETIKQARIEGQKHLQERLIQQETKQKEEVSNLDQQREEQFVKGKIEKILSEVYELLKRFDQDFELDQKSFINKKIDKLLRIKNSTNLEYILSSAEELLRAIQEQEKVLKEKGLKDKQLELTIKTQDLLKELNRSSKPKSLSEDILTRIQTWEERHPNKESRSYKFTEKFLSKIKELFKTPPEIIAIKSQIKVYNKQFFEFLKLYFKESTPDYRSKIKNSLHTIWKARAKAKHTLRYVKQAIKNRKEEATEEQQSLFFNFLSEINLFSGWLLGIYLLFYIVALYVTTKDFGLAYIPQGFDIYDSRIMKYLLLIIFALHASTAVKINFFKASKTANIIIFPLFILSSIVAILNF